MDLNLSQIIEIVHGELIRGYINSETIKEISTDTRTIKDNSLFIPIKGENFDGHDFINKAFENGAKVSLCSYDYLDNIKNINKPIIAVKNTLKAYQNLANFKRKILNPIVVGITGSSGKTSTKELLFVLLNKFKNVLKNEANFNNEIGVPKTLLELQPEHEIAIIEMAMRGPGQIKDLALISEPNIGIITNVGRAHLGELGSEQAILNAKWELGEYINSVNGYMILNTDNKNLIKKSNIFPKDKIILTSIYKDKLARIVLESSKVENNKQYFTYIDRFTGIKGKVVQSLLGEHQINNALLAIAVSFVLGIKLPENLDLSFENLFGREEIIEKNNIIIVNDAYNANPDSMKASLKSFSNNYKGRKVVVLGEMKELGDESYYLHYEVGEFCTSLPIDLICVVGENAIGIRDGAKGVKDKVKFFYNNKEAIINLEKMLKKGDIVLFKGSRGARLEEIFQNIFINS